MSAYNVKTFDLATARDRIVIDTTRNNPVATVIVIQLPVGAAVSLHFGNGGEAWPLRNEGGSFELCPSERDGVYLTNPAGAGDLILGLSYDEGRIRTDA